MVGWRDPRHPRAGGAERYTELALEGLAQRGARVTWVCPAVGGLRARERIGGMDVVRIGRGLGSVPAAGRFLQRHHRKIDLVIDQINTYPMLTPLSFPGPRIALVHQLAGEIWHHHLPAPFAAVGRVLEPTVLRWYRRHRTITVSEDTADDLRAIGFEDVTVVRNAVVLPRDYENMGARTLPRPPAFVALGRLVPAKRMEHAVEAFSLVRSSTPGATLTIIGRGIGRYAEALTNRCAATPGVRCLQNATEQEKWSTLATSTALIATSVREGWGLMVTEANAVGTPSVAYDVPGLRSSTKHGETGLLVPPDPAAAAQAMISIAGDPPQWARLSEKARSWASEHSVARLQTAFAEVVDEELRQNGRAGLPHL